MLDSSPSGYDLVPKIELHLDLEGAIPHEALQMFGLSLAERYRMLAAHQGFSHDEIRGLIL